MHNYLALSTSFINLISPCIYTCWFGKKAFVHSWQLIKRCLLTEKVLAFLSALVSSRQKTPCTFVSLFKNRWSVMVGGGEEIIRALVAIHQKMLVDRLQFTEKDLVLLCALATSWFKKSWSLMVGGWQKAFVHSWQFRKDVR